MNDRKNKTDRSGVIIRTSLTEIAVNLMLAAVKGMVGRMTGSIAVMLDAVNSLSDALTSGVTIAGMKLAGKKPDRKHPLGYGRIEYMSALITAGFVLYAGITSAVESVKKIIAPSVPHYTVPVLLIIAATAAAKLILGTWVKNTGLRVSSGSLTASGAESRFDAVISASVLASAVIQMFSGVVLEAWIGVAIAAMIIRSGIQMMAETLNEIVGSRPHGDFSKAVKQTICEGEPEVSGAYDLVLHSYGPEQSVGSVHIEVPDSMTADRIDSLTRRIQEKVYRKHGVVLTGIGIYSVNTRSEEASRMREKVRELVLPREGVREIHGFYADLSKWQMKFDVVLGFEMKDPQAQYAAIVRDVRAAFPDYDVKVKLDRDVSD
jgi:cation diffusion facilitator family transporter